ncbi:GDSL-like lipase/acylhydrolase family protein [Kitasatospora sp. SolWspMP-SS2h]|uniref:GDSL-type esterase/lipase family protein n=1 Tax=Kitasatospora sp. SolWspMP-SS2h TaxID=1305729 RepID=UPI000DBA0505|nr:GDSL-type esterase/lipase family protein [Kitasatospora sp. SolWspMP-SS2h]RAJ34617.1 GDSL-like lipase/acylhydrolase family protein [Kitasatospora sp. SolWspMP-SS2h]
MTVVAIREYPLVGGPVEVRGALDLERTPAGVMPRRLPAWTKEQYPDRSVYGGTLLPSGVRLVFRTDARVLELEVLTSTGQLDGAPEPQPPGMLELTVDGALVDRRRAPLGHVLRMAGPGAEQQLVPGKPGTVRFAGLPAGMKRVELWLPQQTPTELVAFRADGEVLAPLPDGRPRWVHHGSSISHCPGADGPTGTWPVVAARLAGVEVTNLSQPGNDLLDPYVARTIRDLPADLISLKTGINIVGLAAFRLRTFGPAVHGFLDTIRDGHPDTPLLVVSPVSCPALDTRPGPTSLGPDGRITALGDPAELERGALSLQVVRDELARIVALRQAHDPHLHHLDGRELLGPADTDDLPDGLHPSPAAYRRMGERFAAHAFAPGGPFHSPARTGPTA